MPINVPADCEFALRNQPEASRIAVLIDQIVALIAVSGGGSVGRTPVALSATSIAAGGTAVTVATGPINGGYVENPATETENMYVNLVGIPGSTDAAAAGTATAIIYPGASFNIPALATGVLAKVNAATTGHKISGEKW